MKVLETKIQAIKLAGEYVDYLVRYDLNHDEGISAQLSGFHHENQLKWDNPENIDSGISGIILFLIEYYKKSGKGQYLELIDKYIAGLLDYCDANPTNNYSFYTGRGGVVYILIQRYQLDENELFLKRAVDLILPANQEFLNSDYTSDYLFDGRAGTLFLICELYRITGEVILLDYINQFVFKILSNLRLSSKGVSWNSKEEINLRPSCSFAYGAAGIRYVLYQINMGEQNLTLSSVIDAIDQFIDFCWVKDFENWGDFSKDILNEKTLISYKDSYLNDQAGLFKPKDNYSWANGTVGLLFSSADRDNGVNLLCDNKLKRLVVEEGIKPGHLYDGLAGIGMYFLGGSPVLDEQVSGEIIMAITNKLLSEPFGIHLKGGLFNGNWGDLYFLLKATGYDDSTENILKPFSKSDFKIGLTLKLPELRRNLLVRHYPRVISLLETIEPLAFYEYLEAAEEEDLVHEPGKFALFVENLSRLKMDDAMEERLKDLFELEKQKLSFLEQGKSSSFKVYLEDLLHHDRALKNLGKSIEWLQEQTLFISKEIRILDSKWEWELVSDPNKMKEGHLLNLSLPGGKFEYIMLLAAKREIVEFLLSEDKVILLHQFDQPRKVKHAIAGIKAYMETPDGRLLVANLFEDFGPEEIKDFFDHFDDIVLYKIREWIYSGILIFSEDSKES